MLFVYSYWLCWMFLQVCYSFLVVHCWHDNWMLYWNIRQDWYRVCSSIISSCVSICINVLWSVGVYYLIGFGSWYCISLLILVWVNVVSCSVFLVGWVILLYLLLDMLFVYNYWLYCMLLQVCYFFSMVHCWCDGWMLYWDIRQDWFRVCSSIISSCVSICINVLWSVGVYYLIGLGLWYGISMCSFWLG